jgi:preprotein translocase subunit SecA
MFCNIKLYKLCLLSMFQALTRQLNFALVDEADSVLIDEGRNPMLMSLPLHQNENAVRLVDKVERT